MYIIQGSRNLMGLGYGLGGASSSAERKYQKAKSTRATVYSVIVGFPAASRAIDAAAKHEALVNDLFTAKVALDSAIAADAIDFSAIDAAFDDIIRRWEMLRQAIINKQTPPPSAPPPMAPPPVATTPPLPPPTTTWTPPITTAPPTGLPPPPDVTTMPVERGMSTNTKIAIGVGALALVGVVVFMMRRQ